MNGFGVTFAEASPLAEKNLEIAEALWAKAMEGPEVVIDNGPYQGKVLGSVPDQGKLMYVIRKIHSLEYFGTASNYVIEIVAAIGGKLDVIMLPKVEGAWDIHYLDQLLAQLEARVGTPLLVRRRRGVEPTPAGETLLEHLQTHTSRHARLTFLMQS